MADYNTNAEKVRMVIANIRLLRISKGHTQEYMAKLLNISQTTYSNLEKGSIVLTLDRFLAIAEVLDINSAELLSMKAAKENG